MKKSVRVREWLIAFSLLLPTVSYADPAEVYINRIDNAESANVMFVMDTSGSMLTEVPGSGGLSRMKVMQQSFQEALAQASGDLNVGLMRFSGSGEIGGRANGVSFPISPIDTDAYPIVQPYLSMDNLPDPAPGTPVRAYLSDVANSWVEFNATPIVESLYEGMRYFRGMSPKFGFLTPNSVRGAHPSTYNGTIDPCTEVSNIWCMNERGGCQSAEIPGTCSLPIVYYGASHQFCRMNSCTKATGFATYKSPIKNVCQKNYLVLMTDGAPDLGPPPKDMSTKNELVTDFFSGSACATSTLFGGDGECGPELTHYMATHDQSSSVPGMQAIETFTIGFGLAGVPDAQTYLQSLVSPHGQFFVADTAAQLSEAFKSILHEATKTSTSSASPAYSLNSANNLAHGEDVYVPVFDKSAKVLWKGNLRKFKLKNGTLVGKDNQPITNDDGTFKSTTIDYWSTEVSGNDVSIGGAAALLEPTTRKLLTDVESPTNLANGVLGTLSASNILLMDDASLPLFERTYRTTTNYTDSFILNIVDATTTPVTTNLWWYDCNNVLHTGLPTGSTVADYLVTLPTTIVQATTCHVAVSTDYRERLLSFARGFEKGTGTTTTTPRKFMGDIMHSKPVIYEYAKNSSGYAEKTVFVGSNEGYLHAINAETGLERWAFMPKSLLKNIARFYENNEEMQHIYGVDGQLRLWVNDANKDGVVSGSSEGVYLFFGLGLGGSAYYALNVTDPNNPKLAWTINESSEGFGELGQAWSRPILSALTVQGTDDAKLKTVLVFGAGYDTAKDEPDVTKRLADAKGRDVYIVDAQTGDLIWSLKRDVTTSLLFKHSIAGDIRILDIDRNGSLDRLYFADTGGNVWRVDMDMDGRDDDEGSYNYEDAQLTKLAELGGTATAAGSTVVSHRMFFSEPDVAIQLNKGVPIITVALGSGYRMHPLNTGIQDRFYVLKDDYALEPRPLDAPVLKEDVNLVAYSTLNATSFLSNDATKGWYLPLNLNGEKVIAKALTFMGKIIFTTFAVADDTGTASISTACAGLTTSSRAYVMDLLTGAAVADLNRDGEGNEISTVIKSADILDAPQLVFKTPTASDGTDCKQGDCQQLVEVRVGKIGLPLIDSTNLHDETSESLVKNADLSKVAPRLYWLNNDVSPQD